MNGYQVYQLVISNEILILAQQKLDCNPRGPRVVITLGMETNVDLYVEFFCVSAAAAILILSVIVILSTATRVK